MTNETLQALLAKSDDELWVALGAQISPGMGTRDPRFLRAAAKAWFDERLVQFQKAVCNNSAVALLRSSDDEKLLMTAILDAIAPICDMPSAATASILLIRYGLDRLCPMEVE